jgi:hypothetical protein
MGRHWLRALVFPGHDISYAPRIRLSRYVEEQLLPFASRGLRKRCALFLLSKASRRDAPGDGAGHVASSQIDLDRLSYVFVGCRLFGQGSISFQYKPDSRFEIGPRFAQGFYLRVRTRKLFDESDIAFAYFSEDRGKLHVHTIRRHLPSGSVDSATISIRSRTRIESSSERDFNASSIIVMQNGHPTATVFGFATLN